MCLQTGPAENDAASVLTSSTYSSVKSEDAPSIFDSAASVRSLPNTASSRSSIMSNVSARTAKLLGRKSESNLPSMISRQIQEEESPWEGDDDGTTESNDATGSTTSAAKQKGTFMCGFCKEEGIQKTCTRKNDLKRHIEDFHNMNAQWFCRQRGCQMVFDWQTAYKTHLKHAHGGSRMSLDEAKVNLCPQTVFACGFENCAQVYEAPSDDDAPSTFKDFVAHVVKHFDEGANSGEWTYSARIRNLLRQSGVMRAWNNSSWPEAERNQLCWLPQISGILRKRLETRHIGDLQLLIQYAVALGSSPPTVQKFREDFVVPVKNDCRMYIHGHPINPQPQQMPMQQPQQQQQPQPAGPEQDPFQFKISRGTNPGLAAYMASQRRMYAPRPPVRTGRSARPPARTLNSSSHGHAPSPMAPMQYGFNQRAPAPSPAMFAPPPQAPPRAPQQPQQFHTQQMPGPQYPLMHQDMGGIVADDIRSFQSMTGSASESDMDMTDAMMDSNFMDPQADFQGQYGAGQLQTSSASNMATSPAIINGQDQHPYRAYDGI